MYFSEQDSVITRLQLCVDSMGKNTTFQVYMAARGCYPMAAPDSRRSPSTAHSPAAGGLKLPHAYTGWTASWGFKNPHFLHSITS